MSLKLCVFYVAERVFIGRILSRNLRKINSANLNPFMVINLRILKLLNRQYLPCAIVELRIDNYDVAIVTDSSGEPYKLFIGTKSSYLTITGAHYSLEPAREHFGSNSRRRWQLMEKSEFRPEDFL